MINVKVLLTKMLNEIDKLNDHLITFKTGTISLTDGTKASPTSNSISLTTTDVPNGYSLYACQILLSNGTTHYSLPYVVGTDGVLTWVRNISNSSIVINNATTGWSNYTYYVTLFLKKV